MHIRELRKLLNAKLEYNQMALKGRRITAGRKDRLLKEITSINTMIHDLNQGVTFTHDGDYVYTTHVKVKIT